MTSMILPPPRRTNTSSRPSSHIDGSSITSTDNENTSITGTTNTTLATTTTSSTTLRTPSSLSGGKNKCPSYKERCDAAKKASAAGASRPKLFVPRSTSDFDDGGAFPEIHVAQYPLHMGNPNRGRGSQVMTTAMDKTAGGGRGGGGGGGNNNVRQGQSASTSLTVLNATIDGTTGLRDYTSLVTRGTNAGKKVYASHLDVRPHVPTAEETALPTTDEVQSTAARTASALNSLLNVKVKSELPSGSAIINANTSKDVRSKTEFVQYEPLKDAPGYNPSASRRIVQMVPLQLDPMMPPKHMHLKAPSGPADDPVPVLHSPPRKLTETERKSWNVPACISNWKNTRGYTIPLDKRLAADGRGLRDESTVNPNFAGLSESLYEAERQAREEVRMRALVGKRQEEVQREEREKALRELATRARMERSGVAVGGGGGGGEGASIPTDGGGRNVNVDKGASGGGVAGNTRNNGSNYTGDTNNRSSTGPNVVPSDENDGGNRDNTNNNHDDQETRRREEMRVARRREMERELRMERSGRVRPEEEDNEGDGGFSKKPRLEDDRDISERVALGTHQASGGAAGVDGRLYSQNAGLDSGFGAEDDYSTYSKPLFGAGASSGVSSSSIYRPTRDATAKDVDEQIDSLKKDAVNKFKPDKGFEGGEAMPGGSARSAPVQFEKDTKSSGSGSGRR